MLGWWTDRCEQARLLPTDYGRRLLWPSRQAAPVSAKGKGVRLMARSGSPMRVGLVWRGDRHGPPSERAQAMLGPLFDAFAQVGVTAQGVVYADDAVDEVRAELQELDGVLVWVNPIQDGANRSHLDTLLSEVASRGVFVSANPAVIAAMGTKDVLYATRTLGWGTDTERYSSPEEFEEGFPARLARYGVLVLKQAKGNGGNGVWRVEMANPASGSSRQRLLDTVVRVRQAQPPDASSEDLPLGAFLARCGEYFAWSGSLVDQPYQDRLAEGMIRCYMVHDEVVGFCHQWPKGLLADAGPSTGATSAGPSQSVMEDAAAPAHQALRVKVETEWVPEMRRILGLDRHSLPVIWDADFLHGAKTPAGDDSFVLSEINVSAVWPYPPQATTRLVEAATARLLEAKARRS